MRGIARAIQVALVLLVAIAPLGQVGSAQASAPVGAHLTYNGGRVISNPEVVQVLWGSGSYLSEVTSTSSPSVATFTQNLLNSPYVDWLTEYNTPSAIGRAAQTIGRGTFAGQHTITPSVSGNVTDTQVQSQLSAQIAAGHLPPPTYGAAGNPNTVYAIFFPHGITITQGGAVSGVAGGFCNYHGTVPPSGSIGELYYIVQPDNQPGSGLDTGCGSGSTNFANLTSMFSHQLASTITDPEVGLATVVGAPLAWYDTSNGEIGDICNAQQDVMVLADNQTYTVQKLWSNVANNCIVSRPVAATSDFRIAVSPASLTVNTGASASAVVSTTASTGSAQALSLSTTGLPAGVSASFSPASVTSGGSATLTLSASSTAVPGTYTVSVVGTAASGIHSAALTVTVTGALVPDDFSIRTNLGVYDVPDEGSTTVTIITAVVSGRPQTISLSADGLPSGVTASFAPASVTAGERSTLTLTAIAASGDNLINVTGTGSTATHSILLNLFVVPTPTGIKNGGFEGGLRGWTTTGSASIVASGAHGGTQALQLGSVGPTNGDSTASQSFTAAAGATAIALYYKQECPDTVTYDWATVTLRDNTSSTSATLLPRVCSSTGWTRITGAVIPRHDYTLTLLSHDDNYSGDPTYTSFDDVTIVAAGGDGGGVANGGFELGRTGWTFSGTSSIASAGCRGGTSCALLGATGPTNGDSSASQTFTAAAGTSHLTIWYRTTCPDTVTYDWFTASLSDATAHSTSTLVPHVCGTSQWTEATAPITPGHIYTLVLTNHDDNYAADATYTLVDDISDGASGGGTGTGIGGAGKITSGASAQFTAGRPGSFTVTGSGSPTPALSETGALPAGLTFSPGAGGTATIAGTPDAGSAGTYPITLTATNSVGSGSQTMTLTVVNPTPTVTAVSPRSFTSGGPAATLALTGTGFLPASAVSWGATALATTFVSSTRLTAALGTADLTAASTPQAVIVVVTNPAPGGGKSAPQAITLTSAATTGSDSSVAAPLGSAAAASLPMSAGASGIGATLSNAGLGNATVTVATYPANPGTSNALSTGTSYYDLRVGGADPADSLLTHIYYPSTVTGPAETVLTLKFWDGSAWRPVLGTSAAVPDKNTTDNLDSTVSGGRFTVTFDSTSTPPLSGLTGTYLAVEPVKLDQSISFPQPADHTYGDAPIAVNATASSGLRVSLAAVGPCAATGLSVSFTGAGSCTVAATQEGDGANNPAPAVTRTLTVAPAALTVTVQPSSTVYGDPLPAFGVGFAGFVGSDTAASLTGTMAFRTVATQSSHIGSYSVVASGLSSPNYLITFAPSTLTVGRAPLQVRPVDATRTYGSPNGGFSVSATGFKLSDGLGVLTGTPVFTTPAGPASPVGTYQVTVTGLSAADYAVAFGPGTLTVSPAQLTVVVADASRVYHQPDLAFHGTVIGAVNGDQLSAVYSTTLDAGTAASEYPGAIDASVSGTALPNYAVVVRKGALTITKAPTMLAFTAPLFTAPAGTVTVSAALRESLSPSTPVAGATVTFAVAAAHATGITDATGTAAGSFVLAPGQFAAGATFGGDANHLGATATATTVDVFQPTNFVIWGGNPPALANALTIGQTYQFWGDGWRGQVKAGAYHGGGSFLGLACTVTTTAWFSGRREGGDQGDEEQALCRPPARLPSYLGVIVSTQIDRTHGQVSGNVAEHAVLRLVPCPSRPDGEQGDFQHGHGDEEDDRGRSRPKLYGPDPGRPGCGVLVAVSS